MSEKQKPGVAASRQRDLAVAALEDLKGLELTVLDVAELTSMADYMVVCTGSSQRHVKSLAEAVVERLSAEGERPQGVEGLENGEWVLVDAGDVIVHTMLAKVRDFYQLEKLWSLKPGQAETNGAED